MALPSLTVVIVVVVGGGGVVDKEAMYVWYLCLNY